MTSARIPDDEAARLRSLRELDILDSAPEAEFDALVKVASVVCGVPISLISLIDADRQWFKANLGLPGVIETPRELAFCAHAILEDGIFEVSDASIDPRFADNALVTQDPSIRFYAGATLRLSDGAHAGTLCVIDRQPRQLDTQQREVLQHLATAAVKALEGRRALLAERELRNTASQAAAVLRNSVDAIIAFSMDGLVTDWNASAQRLFGYSAAEMLGQEGSKLVAVHRRQDELDCLAKLEGRQTGITYETLGQHRSGELMAISVSLAHITDAKGEVLGATKIIRDIREQAHAARAVAQSEARFRALSDSSPLGVFAFDPLGACTYTNARWQAIFAMTLQQSLGDGWAKALHPDDRASVFAEWHRTSTLGVEFDMAFRIVRPDGDVHFVRSRSQAMVDTEGLVTGFVGSVEDVTKVHKLSIELAEQHELLRVTLQSIGDAVITTDAVGAVTWLNPVAERMTGWMTSEAQGRSVGKVFHIVNEETRMPIENPVATCLEQGKAAGLAKRTLLVSRDGDEFGIEDSAAPIRNAHGEILGVVLVFHDVTEQRRLSGEMSYRASHDALTGLVNRAEFEVRLHRLLNRVHEDRSENALLYIDLDQFKLVNDACGHSVGDQLLHQVGKLMGEVVRARDTLARLGGDEFAVILEHCSADQAQRVAQQICERLDDFRFIHDKRRFRIGASIGLVPVDKRWSTTAALLQAADTSCYAAKEAGRNRVHAWFDTDQAMRARHGEMQWAARLEQALDENRFALYAQRIQPLNDASQGLHAEVLLRMIDADGSLVPPGAFLPAAERFHLASRIDRWVLRHAIDLMLSLRDHSRIDTLCVNLSGQSIGDRSFHRYAIDALNDAGPEICRRICLEITETAAVTNMADAGVFITDVRALGVRIALDDFGAGASSFGYLKNLDVDLLKIDGQFIRDLIDDPLDDAAVRCFVDVARVIGVKTVAEFVDRPEILARVREIGIDYAQGFLLHRPQPIEQVLQAMGIGSAASPQLV